MKIIQKFEQGKLIPRNKVDNTILKHIKRQGIVLPPSKNEQINADNRTKELKEAQQRDINTKQLGNDIKDLALTTAEGVTSLVYPYVGAALSLKNAYINPNSAYIDAAATMLGGASKSITKLVSKSPKRFGNTGKTLKSIFDKSHGASIEDSPTEVRLGLLDSKGKIKTAKDFYKAFDQAEDKTWSFLTDGTINNADKHNRELYKRIYKRDDLKDITGDRIDEYLKSVEPGVYKGASNEGAQYRHSTKEMQLNLNSPQTYNEAVKSLEHEYRHHGYYGAATTLTPNRSNVNQFYDMKNKRLWRKDIPARDYEYLSIAEEGYNNAIDVGKALGVKLGQAYPGANKFLEMLNNYKGNEGFVIRAFDVSTKPKLRRVWNAITGQYVLMPVTIGSVLNNKKVE